MSENVPVTILMPAYNEAEGIERSIGAIRQAMAGRQYEMLVVNDGSVDGTPDVLARIDGIRVIHNDTNRGYGASLKKGILAAKGDIVCIIDGDMTYPADMIPVLLGHMEGNDMAVGARTGENVYQPAYRRFGNWTLRTLSGIVAGRRIPDLNSGLRAFRKEDMLRFLRILPDGFSFTTTSTLSYLCSGMSVKYVPINYHKRKGRSKIKPLRDGVRFTLLILKVVSYFKPLRTFIPAAAVIASIGVLAAMLGSLTPVSVPSIVPAGILLLGAEVVLAGVILEVFVKRGALR